MYGSTQSSTKPFGRGESRAFPTEFVLNLNVSPLLALGFHLHCETLVSVLLTLHYTGKRNDEENAKEKLYTYASHVLTASFKVGLLASLFFGIPVVI